MRYRGAVGDIAAIEDYLGLASNTWRKIDRVKTHHSYIALLVRHIPGASIDSKITRLYTNKLVKECQ